MFNVIKNYPNYKISTDGKVFSIKRNILLKPSEQNMGYLYVNLCKNGKCKKYTIHKLVIETFLDKVEGKNIINHKDGNKLNNKIENLEWCTQSYNVKDGFNRGRIVYNKGIYGKSHNAKQIKQYTKNGKLLTIWDSALSIYRKLGLDASSIIKCCKGKLRTSGGYMWAYSI